MDALKHGFTRLSSVALPDRRRNSHRPYLAEFRRLYRGLVGGLGLWRSLPRALRALNSRSLLRGRRAQGALQRRPGAKDRAPVGVSPVWRSCPALEPFRRAPKPTPLYRSRQNANRYPLALVSDAGARGLILCAFPKSLQQYKARLYQGNEATLDFQVKPCLSSELWIAKQKL